MTNPPYDPNPGEGVSPRATPAYDTPPSGYQQVQQQTYPHQQPIPHQSRYPRDQDDQSGFPRPGQPRPAAPPAPAPAPAGGDGLSRHGLTPGPRTPRPLNVDLASWGLRVGATLLDFLIVSPLLIGGMTALFQSVKPATYDAAGNVVTLGGPTGTGIFIMLLCFAGVFAASLWQLYRQGTTGQTLGKKAAGILVIRQGSLQPTGFGPAFVRALAHLVDGLPLAAGFFAPLWDGHNKTFADRLCGTLVIRN